ncbi:MAG: hypothetical protein JWS12_428 [Candidatus Saccharibacteria bacterium]|nr:hypothetical protein [Candidatus Saccharibacteria bacterium]
MPKFKFLSPKERDLVIIFGVSNLVCILFFAIRVMDSHSWRYFFLFWNLFLAWLPLVFAWWLAKVISKGRWFSLGPLVLTALWLGFLPNSFYLTSDLIHLQSTGEVSLLFDVVMFMAFIWAALLLGFTSLIMVHKQLLKRIDRGTAHGLITIVLLICSFAIYLGRYLRWSTWDVLVNPAGILFDVTDRFISPSAHPQTFTTTATFFILYGSMYIAIWRLIDLLKADETAAR